MVVAQGYQDATMSTKDSKKIMYFKMVVQKTMYLTRRVLWTIVQCNERGIDHTSYKLGR